MMKTMESDYRTQYTGVAVALLMAALLLVAFAAVSPVAAGSDPIQQGINTDAARYQAMGEFYLAQADDNLLAANPELSFARRSYRAPVSLLAASPELMFARRSYRAPLSVLAANPELNAARRGYSQGAIACSLDEERMVDNPELLLARRVSASC